MNYQPIPVPNGQWTVPIPNAQWTASVTATLNQHSNDLQQLQQGQQAIQQQMQQLQQGQQATQQQMQQLQQGQQAIQQQLQQVQQVLAGLQQNNPPNAMGFTVPERNASRRVHNSIPGANFLPLFSAGGLIPPGFPANQEALLGLTVPTITALLNFYQLPVHGNRSRKLARLQTFITRC